MEVIRIPEVSLVDATGRRIGVYTDDPDWWQQLKQKQNQNMITENGEAAMQKQKTNLKIDNSSSSMREKLINEGSESKEKTHLSNEMTMKPMMSITPSISPIHTEELQKECNVIGETPLHIAIMYDDLNTIKYLIEQKGFDVNERNIGGKFTGGFNSKLTSGLIEQSKYEGLAYYGEYPLAFASCFANKEIYDYLIEKGADPNLQGLNLFFIFFKA
jgi:ankyrin repeat protein